MPQRIEAQIDELISSEQHGLIGHFDYYNPELIKRKLDLIAKYSRLLDHIDRVCQNCRILAKRIIEEASCQEDFDLAHRLMVAAQTHDLSKFTGDEWEYLCDYDKYMDNPKKIQAIKDHVNNNFHHPEAWVYKNGIHSMPDEYICELLADWYARGVEFNRPIKQFMEEVAFKKYGFDKNSAVYKKICYFYKLLTGDEI